MAAEHESASIVKAPLDHGADINIPNPTGQTALQCAARGGFEDVVKLLLENGADVNSKDEMSRRRFRVQQGKGMGLLLRCCWTQEPISMQKTLMELQLWTLQIGDIILLY
ncbi:hypothetical protein QQX98_009274 [Neonectria punicea]|uniref:Uncharacterized protein n=1 Tax=Neonectria punicea TaxID=979145 RepID=A0ABR1GT32_9HYPO